MLHSIQVKKLHMDLGKQVERFEIIIKNGHGTHMVKYQHCSFDIRGGHLVVGEVTVDHDCIYYIHPLKDITKFKAINAK